MYFIGPHVSISGGVKNAPINARALGASGFGMFVKNQRQWQAAPYTEEVVKEFQAEMEANGYTAQQVLPHAGYLINLANPDQEKHAKSMSAMLDEVGRCMALGLDRINFHPGSHLRLITVEEACARVAASINEVLSESEGVTMVVENTVGSGGNLGSSFAELRMILDDIDDTTRIGFCLDTMHLFGAGFDIREPDGFFTTMEEFDSVIGVEFLRGMHLNDSKVELGSRKDRHASLGEGLLGISVFECIMRDQRFRDIPLVIETPDESLWPTEVERLRAFSHS